MKLLNTLTEYGVFSKIFHWISAAVLIIQIPLGFYLVDMDFSEKRITVENIHVTLGLSILYLTYNNDLEILKNFHLFFVENSNILNYISEYNNNIIENYTNTDQ